MLVLYGLFACVGSTVKEAKAQRAGALGVGLMIGGPAGLSVKQWVSNTRAYDIGAAWAIGKEPGVQLHGDFLLHRSDLEGLREDRSYAYYGIGARLKWEEEDARVGFRIPMGVTYLFPDAPLDAFFEVVPVFDVLPGSRLGLNLSIGMRFYLAPIHSL